MSIFGHMVRVQVQEKARQIASPWLAWSCDSSKQWGKGELTRLLKRLWT
ncbi:hypothetical protein BCU66_003725 [Vibrio sp. 10N.286.49.B1]|nr:hypothetical protein [Vibrio sp. 10N.286.48.B7]